VEALVLDAPRPIETAPLRRVRLPVPEPGPGEVLVRVSTCGICRTDLHVIEGELPPRRQPLIPGHQVVGRVERAGSGAARFRPGDRVGIAWLRRTCGVCPQCRRGRENLCPLAEFTGYHSDGGYAGYAVAAEAFAYPIPDVFDDVEAAPLLCAGIIGFRALKLAAVPPGGRLGLYGFGSSAHLTLQVARARGCEVLVFARGQGSRDLALALGARWAGETSARVDPGLDSAIIFAPAGELVPLALRNLAPGGTLSLAGIYMTPVPALDYEDLFHERVVRSVTASTRADGEEFLAEAARVPVRPAVTTFPLDAANEALRRLKHGELHGSGVLVVDERARV
jgi:propanol-preferring alcohol dehydrogenase